MKIKKVILLGSGALKIGEAGEFDYSGTQAIKALKEENIEIVLVNPNVATIQTSQGLADKIYFLPVTPEFVTKVIIKEKPQGILLSFGGQTALNCGIELYRRRILEKLSVAILGTPIEAIIDTEDRARFTKRLAKIGLNTAHGEVVTRREDGIKVATRLGYPVMLRAGFALGGTGSGIARNQKTLELLLTNALSVSPQVVVEECLTGWKEVEYEVVRDKDDNCITVCNMENMDPVGIHTGESIVVAPSQTLNHEEYYKLRHVAIETIRELKIVGECNIQFAINPRKFDYRIIEVNARLSRSSALASKATGYPLAYIAAKLALGYTLPNLRNRVTGTTSAFFEPALDYIVVKIPRWDLDKMTGVETHIGSEMKSVGEVMAIGRTFPEAVQKAARMLNDGYSGVVDIKYSIGKKTHLLRQLRRPTTLRLFTLCSALVAGVSQKRLYELTQIDEWFLAGLNSIVVTFHKLKKQPLTRDLLVEAKKKGFSDLQIADIYQMKEDAIRLKRHKLQIKPFTKRIDTMAGEFPARTNYLYMTYNASESDHQPMIPPLRIRGGKGELRTSKKSEITNTKVAVIGSGPYAIGTSVEFDWCAVQTVLTLRKLGIKSIVVNCNPETVSTDYDYSDYLYFEELTLERILDIYDLEQVPFIVSVGGQIPNNLSRDLVKKGIPLLGTAADQIYQAENRHEFSRILDSLGVAQPSWKEVRDKKLAKIEAEKLGYPLLLRPSFVLSGKGMLVVRGPNELKEYLDALSLSLTLFPLLMTHFLEGAIECDLDGVCDHGRLILSAVSEHVEHGGVHSGDATLVFPPHTLSFAMQQKIIIVSEKIIKKLDVSGPINIQYLLFEDEVYVIECNLRASRSFPFISKALDTNLIELATGVILGKKPDPVKPKKLNYFLVKVPQFSFSKLRGADPILRVEMSSTGEVAAFGKDPYAAFLLGQLATGKAWVDKGAVFVSLGGIRGKLALLPGIKTLVKQGFDLFTTSGTHLFLKENGIASTLVGKIHEGIHPNCLDLLSRKLIKFAVVIPETGEDVSQKRLHKAATDGYLMRRLAIDLGTPLFTNAENAAFYIEAINRYTMDKLSSKSWNEWVKTL